MNAQRYLQIIGNHLSNFTLNHMRANPILIQDNACWHKSREFVNLLESLNIKWVSIISI